MNQTTNRDAIIKHLEMIQGVVNRLAGNSFLIKGWSITLLTVAVLFLIRFSDADALASSSNHLCFAIYLIIMIIGFWYLDAYYLRQERIFRDVYDTIRQRSDTDFAMSTHEHKSNPKNSFGKAFSSENLCIFYGAQIVVVMIIFVIFPLMLPVPSDIKSPSETSLQQKQSINQSSLTSPAPNFAFLPKCSSILPP